MQKLFHVYNTTTVPLNITDESVKKEFYPAVTIVFLLCIITYFVYMNAMKDAMLFQLKEHYNDIINKNVQLIEALLEENEFIRNNYTDVHETNKSSMDPIKSFELVVNNLSKAYDGMDDSDFIRIE